MKILLVAYDNDAYMHRFPQGLGYIAAMLRNKGHEIAVYNQDFHHYPDSHLTEFLDKNRFDVIGISVIAGYYQYRKLLKISEAINKSRQKPFYMLGGHGPSPEPEFFLKKTEADAIVIGEGELTAIELLEAVENGKLLRGIKGIAYRDGEKVIVNERRPLIQNIDALPFPAYDLFPMHYYRLIRKPHATSSDFVMPMLSGRGCQFKCNFCYRMDKGFRPRSNEAIIEEIMFLKKDYGITYIVFSDELLMSSIDRTESLCKELIKAKTKVKWWCNGRLNYARSALLKLMKEAGCVFINYGIEALDDEVLRNMKKSLTVKQIISGVEATLESGISPGLNVIFGNFGETKETLSKGVDFLLRYDDGSQLRTIRPVTPYPGSPLYYYAIQKGFLKNCEDFYENKHINADLISVNFTDLSDEELHQALFDANTKLIRNYFQKKMELEINACQKLYIGQDKNFRGFRHD